MRIPAQYRERWRLASWLAVTTLALSLFGSPAAAKLTTTTQDGGSRMRVATTGWSLIGTLDPQHVVVGPAMLFFDGALEFTPNHVAFAPGTIPASVRQQVRPQVLVEHAGTTYRLVFHLRPTSTTTHFQIGSGRPVQVPAGQDTAEFIETANSPGFWWWALTNADEHTWVFYSVDIYEQTS